MDLLYGNLTYQIRKAIFYVHNHLGYGFNEDIYHQGLKCYFERNGIQHKSKHRESLFHREKNIATFECDFLIEDLIILELKVIQSKFSQDHLRQMLEYLKFWNKKLGLLINFGFEKASIQRAIYSEKDKKSSENYDHFKNRLSDDDRKELAAIRKAILDVFEMHGLGYGDRIYYELLKAELSFKNMDWKIDVEVPIFFDDVFLRNFEIPFLLINDKFLIGVKALGDDISSYDIARTMTYLNKLKKRFGIVAHFGKEELQIRGVYNKN